MMHNAILDVNLAALAANYHLLRQRHARGAIAAVVKANAYGLGMQSVATHLWQQGCRDFFVATLEEGIDLRKILANAKIGVFSGLLPSQENDFIHYQLAPVLNDLGQVERFCAKNLGDRIQDSILLHIDTGMTRLGLSAADLTNLPTQIVSAGSRTMVLSHLACAADTKHPKNAEQLSRFQSALRLFSEAKASLSNSSGLFLASDFHFDMGRPGCALYGINPTQGVNPMQQVVQLSAPLLQIRTLDRDETIGYDATFTASKGCRIAIAGLGYADGWARTMSNKGFARIASYQVPVIGIVSMDMTALDVTSVPNALLEQNTRAEFIHASQTVDDVAKTCGTIGYEILTRMGNRVHRHYS